MFSPYYAWARRGGRSAPPERHVAVNVLLGGPNRWTMTERGAAALERSDTDLRIGPSTLHWDGTALTIGLRERGLPFGQAVRGTVRVMPAALTGFGATLDAPGRHRWRPMSPRARVEVALDRPGVRWSGTGYLDSNDGDEPLEAGFSRWDWCRAPLPGGGTQIVYDTYFDAAPARSIAIGIAPDGSVAPIPPPPPVTLARTRWRLPRFTRAEAASVRRTQLDAPFYARSVLDLTVGGHAVEAVHESLDLRRFAAPWTQAMLPFRVPRRG